ncbi:MAG: hypothetical protein CL681_02410 [Blastopirellula sp.]|nr:hypothetical protein [Blastopirellula sp.]
MLHSKMDEKLEPWCRVMSNSRDINLAREVLRVRMIEEEIAVRYKEQEMRCPVHLSIGQEACAVAVCWGLTKSDIAFSGHRNHAHYLAKGGDLKKLIAELYGKRSGCSGGMGGSMHITDITAGFIASSPIVGSIVPIAVGASYAKCREDNDDITIVFLGDGAVETGAVHEAMNIASLKKLPILMVCENNLYSVYTNLEERRARQSKIYKIAEAHGIKAKKIEGSNIVESHEEAMECIQYIRNSREPYFLEIDTYRYLEHCGPNCDDNLGYRNEEEITCWKAKDPIEMAKRILIKSSLLDSELKAIKEEIKEAFDAAINDEWETNPKLNDIIYDNKRSRSEDKSVYQKKSSRIMTYSNAIREAHEIALEQNTNNYVMGLGVTDPKGIFGSTKDLDKKFGRERVFDIPISENAITGFAIGSAIMGMRPVLTHQRVDFALASIEQITNQAAKWHYMFNGAMSAPLVLRMIIGRGWGQGPQHSQCLHAWFAHIPGLKVIMPATAYDAKGMLLSAINDNNPVICLEHRWLYDTTSEVPDGYYEVEIGKSKIVKEGTDITIIGMSYSTLECIEAHKLLQEEDIIAEIIDLRSIKPLDMSTILKSVDKTKNLLVVDLGQAECSVARDIASQVAEARFNQLENAPTVLSEPSYPVPTSHYLSEKYYISAEDITKQVLKTLKRQPYSKASDKKNYKHDQPNVKFRGPF